MSNGNVKYWQMTGYNIDSTLGSHKIGIIQVKKTGFLSCKTYRLQKSLKDSTMYEINTLDFNVISHSLFQISVNSEFSFRKELMSKDSIVFSHLSDSNFKKYAIWETIEKPSKIIYSSYKNREIERLDI